MMPTAPPEERALHTLVAEAESAGRKGEALRLAEERLEMGRIRLGVRPFTFPAPEAILPPVEPEQQPERRGEWIATWPTRTRFYPLDPRPEDVHIEDIAQALSNTCRYGGHVPLHYSVAQHSVLVAELCLREGGREAAQVGLLHDAAEAYVGDATWPYKRAPHMGEHCAVEGRIQAAVYERFGVEAEAHEGVVKRADARVLMGEARSFLGDPDWARERVGEPGDTPWPERPIQSLEPQAARALFLNNFEDLFR